MVKLIEEIAFSHFIADSLGFGAGAVTRLEGVESVNTNDFERYCARSADFAAITESVHSVEARPA